ncbi:MAG TPA: methylenetetrahydrofolate reductase C-terminal domain-containing protein [Anaerolineae bacterium]|nr:methylenetetrahydrofolate reductase C-terminal domain-containing protein [Anaerolineae bacterium]
MIVGEQKPLQEIKELIGDGKKVLVAGCGTCVAVCFAGGEREAEILTSALNLSFQVDGQPKDIEEIMVQRQCEWEYVEPLADKIVEHDVVVSLACGIGVQTLVERFPDTWIVPGLNTTFLGMPQEQGIWVERCQACGNCILAVTGGICPVARCSKQLLNGPCGGSQNGICEVDPDMECAWQLVYDRLSRMGRLDLMVAFQPAKDWSVSRDGGPRKIVRKDLLMLGEVEY